MDERNTSDWDISDRVPGLPDFESIQEGQL